MSKKVSALLAALLALTAVMAGCGSQNLEVKLTPDTSATNGEAEKNEVTEQVTTLQIQEEIPEETISEDVTVTEETTPMPEEVKEEVTEEVTESVVLEQEETQAPVVTEPPAKTQAEVPQTTQPPAPTEPVFVQEVEPTYINGILIVNKTYPLPPSYAPGCLSSDTDAAFKKMAADAYAEGLTLWVQSGYRSYDLQKDLYNRYVARDGQTAADTYSARPGHSEHQSGLAFDLNTIDDSFANTAEGQWVAQNCHKYGFIVRYPKGKEHLTGYQYESWHLRYLGVDTATAVYESGLCLEEYLGITSEYSY